MVERRSGYRDCDHVQWEGSGAWQGRVGGRVVVNYYGILYNWLRLYDEGEIRVNTVQPSLVDAPLIAQNKEEGADKHGKDTRDAMSGSLFSSEVVGRALMFLLSQPSITISHRNLYRPLVIYQLMLHRITLSLPVLSRSRYSWHHPTLFGKMLISGPTLSL